MLIFFFLVVFLGYVDDKIRIKMYTSLRNWMGVSRFSLSIFGFGRSLDIAFSIDVLLIALLYYRVWFSRVILI